MRRKLLLAITTIMTLGLTLTAVARFPGGRSGGTSESASPVAGMSFPVSFPGPAPAFAQLPQKPDAAPGGPALRGPSDGTETPSSVAPSAGAVGRDGNAAGGETGFTGRPATAPSASIDRREGVDSADTADSPDRSGGRPEAARGARDSRPMRDPTAPRGDLRRLLAPAAAGPAGRSAAPIAPRLEVKAIVAGPRGASALLASGERDFVRVSAGRKYEFPGAPGMQLEVLEIGPAGVLVEWQPEARKLLLP